jgi:hypothetical protein
MPAVEPGYYIVKTTATPREYELCYYAGRGEWFFAGEDTTPHGEDVTAIIGSKINVDLNKESYGKNSFSAGWDARERYETAKSQVFRRLTEHETEIYQHEKGEQKH